MQAQAPSGREARLEEKEEDPDKHQAAMDLGDRMQGAPDGVGTEVVGGKADDLDEQIDSGKRDEEESSSGGPPCRQRFMDRGCGADEDGHRPSRIKAHRVRRTFSQQQGYPKKGCGRLVVNWEAGGGCWTARGGEDWR